MEVKPWHLTPNWKASDFAIICQEGQRSLAGAEDAKGPRRAKAGSPEGPVAQAAPSAGGKEQGACSQVLSSLGPILPSQRGRAGSEMRGAVPSCTLSSFLLLLCKKKGGGEKRE